MITNLEPFRELEEISARLNRMFRSSMASAQEPRQAFASAECASWAPFVDICETSEDYQFRFELPEVKKEDIRVCIENGMLRMEGERRCEMEENGKRFHRMERSYGSFVRCFAMPNNVDETKICAEFKDGMLTVRMPKSEKAKSKAIDIKIF